MRLGHPPCRGFREEAAEELHSRMSILELYRAVQESYFPEGFYRKDYSFNLDGGCITLSNTEAATVFVG